MSACHAPCMFWSGRPLGIESIWNIWVASLYIVLGCMPYNAVIELQAETEFAVLLPLQTHYVVAVVSGVLVSLRDLAMLRKATCSGSTVKSRTA